MSANALGRRGGMIAVLLVTWVTLLGAGKPTMAGADEDRAGSIYVCVKESGRVRIVGANAKCQATEKKERWSITLPPGPYFPITCPPDSVPTGATCLDRYEASLWQTMNPTLIQRIKDGTVTKANLTADGAIHLGLASGDLDKAGCPATGKKCVNVYAVSIPGVMPARFITWFQAAAAARNAGKRLPTNAEWQAAALGTPDPGASPAPSDCNTKGNEPDLAGERGNCVSDVGAFDMVGNVSEWLADWVPLSTTCGSPLFSGTDDANCLAWASPSSGPAALVRGGDFGSGASAGVFAVEGKVAPSGASAGIGFRAAR